jgi:hypothetical protein
MWIWRGGYPRPMNGMLIGIPDMIVEPMSPAFVVINDQASLTISR